MMVVDAGYMLRTPAEMRRVRMTRTVEMRLTQWRGSMFGANGRWSLTRVKLLKKRRVY
jgi:hypothetical protein